MTQLSYSAADHTINTEDKPSPAPAPEIGEVVAQQLLKIDGELSDLAAARELLKEVFLDSGFANLFEPLQDKISAFIN
jgi:hypothetical protein